MNLRKGRFPVALLVVAGVLTAACGFPPKYGGKPASTGGSTITTIHTPTRPTTAATTPTVPTVTTIPAGPSRTGVTGSATESWSAPSVIDPGGSFRSVFCVSVSFCAAVGGTNALTYHGTSWGTPVKIDTMVDGEGAGGLTDVSCASASFCVAVDELGYAFVYSGSSWGEPRLVDPDATPEGGPLLSVSCPTSSFCTAVDALGHAVTYAGTTWRAPLRLDPATGLVSVSCPTSSYCVAVDMNGHEFTYRDSAWGMAKKVESLYPYAFLQSVSCPSSAFCATVLASGNARFNSLGDALVYNGSSWSAPKKVDPGAYLVSVSCPSSSFCVAVGLGGYAVSYNGSSWSRAAKVDSALSSVSCASASFCVAVDNRGRWIHTLAQVPSGASDPRLATALLTVRRSGPKPYRISCGYPVLSQAGPSATTAFNSAIASAVSKHVSEFEAEVSSVVPMSAWSTARTPSTLTCTWGKSLLDKPVASAVLTFEQFFTGAAHPFSDIRTFNFDLGTAHEYVLADLFTKGTDWLKVLTADCRRSLAAQLGPIGASFGSGRQPVASDFPGWSLTSASMQITFQEYQVAPYAYGTPTVTIPIEDLEPIANPGGPLASIR